MIKTNAVQVRVFITLRNQNATELRILLYDPKVNFLSFLKKHRLLQLDIDRAVIRNGILKLPRSKVTRNLITPKDASFGFNLKQ